MDLGFFNAVQDSDSDASMEEALPIQPSIVKDSMDIDIISQQKLDPKAAFLNVQEEQSHPLTALAHSHWLKSGKITFKKDLVKTIWMDHLLANDFDLKTILLLNQLEYLEKYLLTHYNASSTCYHLWSIALCVIEKARLNQDGSVFTLLNSQPELFQPLFTQCLTQLVDDQTDVQVSRFLLAFVHVCFQRLELPLVRTFCIKLVNIAIWKNLGSDIVREELLSQHSSLIKLWNTTEKKYQKANSEEKQELDFFRTFVSRLIGRFFQLLKNSEPAALLFCERFLQWLIDLESQLPTRRYFNALLQDHHVLAVVQESELWKRGKKLAESLKGPLPTPSGWGIEPNSSGALFYQLANRLEMFVYFEIHDQTGIHLDHDDLVHVHHQKIQHFQQTAFSHYEQELKHLSLAGTAVISEPKSLKELLASVPDHIFYGFCDALGVRTRPLESDFASKKGKGKEVLIERSLLVHSLAQRYRKRPRLAEQVFSVSSHPSENQVYDESVVPVSQPFFNTHPLAVPRLSLQFISSLDYLYRNYQLFYFEASDAIRSQILSVVRKLKGRIDLNISGGRTKFTGKAPNAIDVFDFKISQVAPPRMGELYPSSVEAELTFDLSRMDPQERFYWDSLGAGDNLMLLSVVAGPYSLETPSDGQSLDQTREHYGIQHIRSCKIRRLLGDDGKPMAQFTKLGGIAHSIQFALDSPLVDSNPKISKGIFGNRRTLVVALDGLQYHADSQTDLYEKINVMIRHKVQDLQYFSALESVQDMIRHASDVLHPNFQDMILGYGNPNFVHYSHHPKAVSIVDLQGHLLDSTHSKEALPDLSVSGKGKASLVVLPKDRFSETAELQTTNAAQQIIDHYQLNTNDAQLIHYQVPNPGPYPQSPVKQTYRYNKEQVEALLSSLSPGMTLVQGPPSSGKTLLSAQIAQSLYHNYKNQRTVMVFKNERNLAKTLQLLLDLGISEHHLVVYGHGEDTPWSPEARVWGIHGRTDACLRKRTQLLGEVDRLVSSLGIVGAYGKSCEQAEFFYKQHIQSRWQLYTEQTQEASAEQLIAEFPFTLFFATAPQPLFPPNASLDQIKDVTEGCYRHLCRLFDDLRELQPLEVFREIEERAFYHLIGMSRLVLMTSAQMFCGRKELIARRFRYDQLILDEAHKFSELESLFAMSLQRPKTEDHPLKRVILLGDSEGLHAKFKCTSLVHVSNIQQSFFERMLRLGVPSISLTQIPVTTPLLPLWSWKYPKVVSEHASLVIPGLGYDYQFVHVPGQEHELLPGNYQNVEEAEWLIAMYLYLRQFGYHANQIAIITPFVAQRALLDEILYRKDGQIERPDIATIETFDGSQADIVLVSLVRTSCIVAEPLWMSTLSRARKALYLIGTWTSWKQSGPAPLIELLDNRPHDLCILPKEGMSTKRKAKDIIAKRQKEEWKLILQQANFVKNVNEFM